MHDITVNIIGGILTTAILSLIFFLRDQLFIPLWEASRLASIVLSSIFLSSGLILGFIGGRHVGQRSKAPKVTSKSIGLLPDNAKGTLYFAYREGTAFKFDDRMLRMFTCSSDDELEMDESTSPGLDPAAAPALERAGLIEKVDVCGSPMWIITAQARKFLGENPETVESLEEARARTIQTARRKFEEVARMRVRENHKRMIEEFVETDYDLKFTALLAYEKGSQTLEARPPRYKSNIFTCTTVGPDAFKWDLRPEWKELFDAHPEVLDELRYCGETSIEPSEGGWHDFSQ